MAKQIKQEDIGDFIEAAGLLEYDPEKISKIYQGHPLRLFKRILETLLPIACFFLKISFEKLFGFLKDINTAKKRAREFAELLVELGPAFIKAGQALSTRPDLIPVVVLEELSQLQDQLPGFEGKLAMACIKEDLGKDITEIFKEIDENPISAASLGQVHKALLKGNKQVAVKVQRPGLREQITLDLYIVRNIAKWLNNNIKFIRSDLVALIDELGTRVFEEMDYLNEARNAIKFKKLHSHNLKIAVPKVYKEISSRRVLVMEWIDGTKLTNLDQIKKLGLDSNELIEIGVNCSLQQLLEHGFFHADPHPGNLLALDDGRLCYLDFGMMSNVSRNSRTGLIQAVVHLVNKDFDKLSQDFVKLGFLSSEVNLKPIIPAFEKVFKEAVTLGVNKLDFKSVTDDMSGVMYKFPFRVPPYYALIIRSLITLEGIALSVDPEFKILGAAYPYFARRLMEDDDPQLRQSLKEMIFEGSALKWNRLEELIVSAAGENELNINKLLDNSLDYIFSDNGIVIREKIVNSAVNQLDWLTKKTILKSKDISKSKAIKEVFNILIKLPGYEHKLLISKIPRVITEKKSIKMGFDVAKELAKKNAKRIIKRVVKK